MLRLQHASGQAIESYLNELASLRIRVFRDYPYLYDGNLAYEAEYLQTYVNSARSLCLLLWDGDQVVGASTALPLADESDAFRQPFVAAGIAPAKVFYFGESVLLPQYRGQGWGVRFFTEREAHARQLGGFDWCAFCAVERPPDHPLCPAGYQPLDPFWQKRGFAPRPDLQSWLSWPDIGTATTSHKALNYWLKRIST